MKKLRKTQEQFILECKENNKHRDYSFENTIYKGSEEEVEIYCNIHKKTFITVAGSICAGKGGCKECGIEARKNKRKMGKEKFTNIANDKHSNRYDYSKVVYTNSRTNVEIICKKHGSFFQSPESHLNGRGCPYCANKKRGKRDNVEKFIQKAISVHGDTYDYSDVVYKSSNKKVAIICKKHGIFYQIPNSHLNGRGCHKCSTIVSRAENEIADFIRGLGIDVITSDKKLISPKELDIVIPSHKIAIEYNGLHWHNVDALVKRGMSEKEARLYHKTKTDLCAQKGYRLIHIFEDDFVDKKEVILRFLKHTLGKSESKKIYARKTNIQLIDSRLASSFYDKYHIQGKALATYHYGAFYNGELVAATSFMRGKKNTSNSGSYELVRHATKHTVIGSLGKALKHFIREHEASKIFTFCDLSYFNGESYTKAGFEISGKALQPDYKYVVDRKRVHKFNFRLKSIEEKYGITGLSENEAMKKIGIPRIYDCGKIRFEINI